MSAVDVIAFVIGGVVGFVVLGEFLCGWFFRMGTLVIKPGSRRGRPRR